MGEARQTDYYGIWAEQDDDGTWFLSCSGCGAELGDYDHEPTKEEIKDVVDKMRVRCVNCMQFSRG